MVIIDAIWEKRNIGVSCLEITIEDNDSIEAIQKKLPICNAQYVVVKVPSYRVDVMFELSRMQFNYIEASMHITHNLKNLHLNNIQKRLDQAVTYELMNETDILDLFDEIKKGMFETDRIYLDPYFTKEQASNRYINWIADEARRGTNIFKLIYKNLSVGFFAFKDIGNGIYYPFLVGMYKDFKKSGLGFCTLYKPLSEAVKRNGKILSTYISTNNINAINLHNTLNFHFDQINYVYVKHSE